ncbi:hypothetical protein SDC9_183801 [bioreactor metagenome]|uniref:Uncharacterized protein n=1 Tax=bioreactor metagenome TaxID=1076179 RepID=A0A645HD50_9ZZZZ
MQLAVAIDLFGAGFGRNGDQRILIAAHRQMTVNGVMAEIRCAAHKPFGKWRLAVITDLLGLLLPIDQPGLLCPEAVAVINGTLIKIFETRGHEYVSLTLRLLQRAF